jgi:predicted GNAT superfamily acetyltransferase
VTVPFRIEDLTTFAQFQQVERLEADVWGPIDLVPVPIMAVTVRRGAVLLGAYDGDRLAGFVYSFPALRHDGSHNHEGAKARRREDDHDHDDTMTRRHDGSLGPRASHWSHTLGVHSDYRGAGLGRELKLAQRERVLALGLDLIEWTYDPLLALNANLNIVALGAVVEEYEENVYGESVSPLHGGLPTDRFVCQWWIRRPHVERRIRRQVGQGGQVGQVDRVDQVGEIRLVAHEVAHAPVVNDTTFDGTWLDCGPSDLTRTEPRIAVDIPIDFAGMLTGDLARARRWRFHLREIFTHYFHAGYRVVDFTLHREHHRGRYLLTSIRPPID